VRPVDEKLVVTLSGASKQTVTVHFATVNGTAHAGSDYDATQGTLTFAPGTTSQTITVHTHPGAFGSEALQLQLSQPAGATLARGAATATIVNPAPPPPPPIVTVQNIIVHEPPVSATPPQPSGPGSLLPAGCLSTKGNQIVDQSGHAVKIAAVNWFGMETSNFAPHGPWAESYKSMMDEMVKLGFNAIRLPFSDQLFDAGSVPTGSTSTRTPTCKASPACNSDRRGPRKRAARCRHMGRRQRHRLGSRGNARRRCHPGSEQQLADHGGGHRIL
jgi:endoglucanase